MDDLGYLPFDCDNHYYEAPAAFTRHVPDHMQERCVQWCEINGRKYHVVGGTVSHAVVNPTWDPIAKPGALHEYFRGNPSGRSPLEMLKDREPLPAEYMDRDARVAKIKEQGLEAVWLFPTLGVLYEELIKHDTEAVKVLFRAFNRWLDEDWGCNYQDTIYAAPYISLCDPQFAVEELEWALDRGARVVCMRPAAVWTEHGPVSPANPMFDPFWARLNEAGIPLVIHAADSGYTTQGYAEDGFGTFSQGGGGYTPSIKAFHRGRRSMSGAACWESNRSRPPPRGIAVLSGGSRGSVRWNSLVSRAPGPMGPVCVGACIERGSVLWRWIDRTGNVGVAAASPTPKTRSAQPAQPNQAMPVALPRLATATWKPCGSCVLPGTRPDGLGPRR